MNMWIIFIILVAASLFGWWFGGIILKVRYIEMCSAGSPFNTQDFIENWALFNTYMEVGDVMGIGDIDEFRFEFVD